MRALLRLLEVLESNDKLLNIGEFFRDSEYSVLFDAIEAGALRWQERGLSGDEFEAEFFGAWRKLLETIRRARITVLLEKSRQHGWSVEEQAQFLLLQQEVTSEIPK